MLGRLFLASCGVAVCAFAAAPPLRIALVGDSTVHDDGGWGPGFAASFDRSAVEVLNFARNGRSSKSFRSEGWWQKALAAKPRWVLIQFGHNDNKGKGPDRETDPRTTYRENLARYVAEARAIGAQAVLVTPIVRRRFGADGKIVPDQNAEFAAAARDVAAREKLPLMDLYALSLAEAERGGPPNPPEPDSTHLTPKAKAVLGSIAAREFLRIAPELRPHWHELVSWNAALRQRASWYGSAEAVRIADNVLVYQHDNGGWEKNVDLALPLAGAHRAEVLREKALGHTTIDNGSTYTQIRYLARVAAATGEERYRDAVRKGLAFLHEAQYANGGWPQFYPLRRGYWDHITYNDGAMTGVLELLRDVAARTPEFAFLSDAERERARGAIERGVECILRSQIRRHGKPTVWCAQHDETTLLPAKARAYELPSFSGSESVAVVRFLMGIEQPSPEVVRAVQGAVAWFSASAVRGIRVERRPAPGTPKGTDTVVVADPAAPPLWARFYDLETNKPLFCGRDGIPKDALSEIEYERRNGYRWYVDTPAKLLNEEYPKWMRRWAPGEDARK